MEGNIVAFLGLNSLSNAFAASLIRSGYSVRGFDLASDHASQFSGILTSSASEACKGAAVLLVTQGSSDEVQNILFGFEAAISEVSSECVVVLFSPVSSSYFLQLEKSLKNERNSLLVDAAVSGFHGNAIHSKPMLMVSGTTEALDKALSVLSSMCEKVSIVSGGLGAARKAKMVDELLVGIHIASAAEAMVLGARAGLNTRIVFEIISNAAGSSRAFVTRVPQMLGSHFSSHSTINGIVKNLGQVLDEAKSLPFPLPLTAMAFQQLVHGSACGYGQEADAAVVKIWQKSMGVNVAAPDDDYNPELTAKSIVSKSKCVKTVGFIGLGAMGFGMATHLIKSKFHVCGFDVYKPTLERFVEAGGSIGNSPSEVAKDSEVLIIMVTNESQAESVLFGDDSAVLVLPVGATIIVCSTVTPRFMRELKQRLEAKNKDLQLVDAPVSGGVVKAANGSLTIMASGVDEALARVGSVLSDNCSIHTIFHYIF